jgi:2-iminobutanoate/2-iminopropanoate deaminase
MKTHILTGPDVPPIIGHYCHATESAAGLILLSGQKGWRLDGSLVPGGLEAEFRQAFQNIETILRHLGLGIDSLARITCYLAGDSEFMAANAVYEKALGSHRPARALIGGCALRGGARIELVAEAFRS